MKKCKSVQTKLLFNLLRIFLKDQKYKSLKFNTLLCDYIVKVISKNLLDVIKSH